MNQHPGTTNPSDGPGTGSGTQLSGVDLARVALKAARESARARQAAAPGGRDRNRRGRRAGARIDGRDPVTLETALDLLVAERGWQAPAAAGSVVDQWGQIAPELVGKVRPVHYDPDTRQLDLLPASPAYATQMRLLARQMVTRINTKAGTGTVKTIRVLPPGPSAAGPDQPNRLRAQEDAGPVKTREDASPGYRQALAAHQAAKKGPQEDLEIRAAVEQHDQALRAHREPEEAFADAREFQEQLAHKAAAAEDVHARARARARQEKAGRAPEVPRAFARTA